MMEMIELTIICALLLWIWYSGGFSKKSQQKSNIPVPNCYPGCVCYSLVNQQPVTENFPPVVLPAVHEDGETTESDNDRLPPETLPQPLSNPEAVDPTHQPGIETLIETDERTEPEDADLLKVAGDSIECVTDKNLAETTEIPPHEMETLPQLNNPDDSIAIATNNKIDPSWKPDPLPLTETDEPDDSDDEFIIPPNFFVNPNQTEPETIPAEAADEPEESDEEVKITTEDENVPLEADLTHQEAVTASQEDMMDSIVPDSPSPESPSPKRFSFQLTQLPYLPDGYYITLSLNERGNDGKIKKTKILSSRDPQWSNQKSFSFAVHDTEETTITTKLKRKALLCLKTFTEDARDTKLINNENEIQLLAGFKVAAVRIHDTEPPFDIKKRKKELAKKKREERKLKGRLASCEQYGIDPFVRLGSDETFGLGQKKEKINIITEPEIKPKKISFWVRHGFLYPKDRYTRRRFE